MTLQNKEHITSVSHLQENPMESVENLASQLGEPEDFEELKESGDILQVALTVAEESEHDIIAIPENPMKNISVSIDGYHFYKI